MDFLHNIRKREQGKGFVGVCDFIIPRLVSDPEDCYLQLMDTTNDPDASLISECLVGRFCPFENTADLFAMSDEDGFVILQDTSLSGKDSILKKFRAHDNAIFDLTWMISHSGSMQLVTASGDKRVALWDAETLQQRCLISSHEQSLRTVCAHPDVPGFLVTGGRDGKICINDHRCDLNFPVSVIVDAHLKPEKEKNNSKLGKYRSNKSVTSLVLKDEFCLISGGYTDGLVKVWDLRRTYSESLMRQPAPLHLLPVGATVTSLVLRPRDNLLYTSCTNNAIMCFDAINFSEKPVSRFVGHSTNSQYSSFLQCSVSSCGRYLACGSAADTAVHIWSTAQAHYKQEVTPIAKLEGHAEGVHCVQWSHKPGELKLTSLSEDNTHRIWRMGPSLSEEKCREPNTGHTVITAPSFFKSRRPRPQHLSVQRPVTAKLPVLSEMPNFVHNPSSVVHTCSPRVAKPRLNWLTALSPQNAVPSAGKVVKLKRPATGNKKKSSKKLLLSSPHFKAVLKPRQAKL